MSYYDPEQFRKDCETILNRYGKSRQYGFYTVYDYEHGLLRITTEGGFRVLYDGVAVKTVKMGTPLSDFILQRAVESDEYFRSFWIK